ncbi:2Fe-2S iron-sulfur cluster-binding protein [Marinomonas flavescens]|uniref:2Fe-2S iron-sulfur cluster-binding protein n=1 Tax=Marinomonas flavescens TaxID=2529379 RepID=UPI0010549D73|nr:2Fe-2S iron-sulfur cluster-binding protein [Marinomonas flavescens]
MNRYELTITKVEALTHDSKALYFDFNDNIPSVLPGQFLTFLLDINDKEVRRSYSLCTFGDEQLGVGVKKVPGGIASTYLNTRVRKGMKVSVLAPSGNFTFNAKTDEAQSLLLVAGGSGITPMLAIMKSALLQTEKSVTLIYINKSQQDVMFLQELEEWTLNYSERLNIEYYFDDLHTKTIEVKKPGILGWLRPKEQKTSPGFINPDRFSALLNKNNLDLPHSKAYLCGPTGLMDMVFDHLMVKGMPKNHILREQFVSQLPINPKPNFKPPECDANIELYGEKHLVKIPSGVNVLQAAIEAGIDMPFSCREGTCTACYSTCKSGEVSMLTDKSLTDEELKSGGFLPCVSFPKSKVLNIVIE